MEGTEGTEETVSQRRNGATETKRREAGCTRISSTRGLEVEAMSSVRALSAAIVIGAIGILQGEQGRTQTYSATGQDARAEALIRQRTTPASASESIRRLQEAAARLRKTAKPR
jgi:hypothetical protein